jgi:hypothetical protein
MRSVNFEELIVHEKDGPYHSISAALLDAKPNSTIYVSEGLYSERLVITTPGIKILPRSKSQQNDIILLSSFGASIEVNIPGDGKCEIHHFKVTHTAKEEEPVNNTEEKKKVVTALMGIDKDFLNYDENDPRGWKGNTISINGDIPCLVRVKSGKLTMKVSSLNLADPL